MTHARGFFITGTDTGVGKTWCAAALLAALRHHGYTALGMKPVASGCMPAAAGLRSDDARLLMAHGSPPAPPYALTNPYALAAPIAPHLAAQQQDLAIDLGHIIDTLRQLQEKADFVVVEGIGGWLVPLNARETVADLAQAVDLPVILVVGIRLGCLNHALLTADAIQRSGTRLAGWIANPVDPHMQYPEENIQSLQERIAAPLLGVMPHLNTLAVDLLAAQLDLASLLRTPLTGPARK